MLKFLYINLPLKKYSPLDIIIHEHINHGFITFLLQVDPNNTGSVGAADAAKFLKKSGLSDVVLSKVSHFFQKCELRIKVE